MTLFSCSFLTVLTVDLLAAAGDVALSWTSPIYPKLYSNDTSINPLRAPITPDEDSWLGSVMTIGSVIGPLPFGIIAEKFGRKIGLLSVAVPHIVSYITFAFAKNIYLFYFARFLGGLAVGGGYTLLPMYIAEISRDANRGAMCLTLSIFWALGSLLPYAIGPFLSICWFNIVLASIPLTFFVLFAIIGSETPYYLVSKQEIRKAEKTLMFLRSLEREDVQEELFSIKSHLKLEENGHFSDIIRNKWMLKTFIICVILICIQEFAGYSAILFRLQPIFEATGTKLAPDISALIVGLALFVSSIFGPFLVDRVGRRLLTVLSCFGMCIAMTALGAFFYIADSTRMNTKPIFWIPICSLMFYIVSFNMGVCCVPWTITAEVFPNNVKAVAASSFSSTCSIVSFVTTKSFNDMNDVMGNSGTFWFFATTSFASGIFCICCVPETKGKSFSEIQDMLKLGVVRTTKLKSEAEIMLEKLEINR